MIKVKRVYEPVSNNDGYRILVDRLWPRGMSKTRAKLDLWLKDIAPSTELRQWFSHDPEKWEKFKKSYFKELENNPEAMKTLVELIDSHKTVTLLFAVKDERLNEAAIIKEYLERKTGL